MSKTILLYIIICLCTFQISAQTNNFKAYYKVKLSLDKESKADNMMSDMFGNFEKISSELDFELKVSNGQNIFFLRDKVYTNRDLANLASIKSDYYGRSTIKDSLFFTEYDSKVFNVKAVLKKQLPQWELHSDTKVIQGYNCFKATTTKVVRNTAGIFTFPITAWYCPEVSSSLGPIGYGGLPGLIFELRGNKYVYGLVKLEFNSTKAIEKLKDYKIVGQMELDMMIQENLIFKQ